MKARFVPNSYEGVLIAEIYTPATQTAYQAGDTFNPNGLSWQVEIGEQSQVVSYSPNYNLNEGDTLNTNDTYQEVDVYIRHQRASTQQPISVT